MPLITCPCEEHAPMREVERNGIHIDVCTKCRGVWLDRGELEKLLTGVRGAAAEFERERESFDRGRAANPSQARPQPQPQPHPQQDMRRYGGEGGEGGERGWFGGEGGEGGERSGAYGQPRKKKSWLEAFDIFD